MSGERYSDETLRSAYRALVDAEDRSGPDADRIWDAVAGSSPVEERRKVVDEIAERPGSALFWQLARELQTEERERTENVEAESPAPPTAGRRLVWYGG